MKTLPLYFISFLVIPSLLGQVPDAAPGGGNTTIVNNQQKDEPKPFVGNDMPFLDPGSETASWNGKAWNVTNNRLIRGRFEKYLAAPEDDSDQDKAYRKVVNEIIQALTPKQGVKGVEVNLNKAVGLLPLAAEFPIDAKLCDAIASAIYTVWMVQKNETAMVAANKAMEKEIGDLAVRVEVGADGNKMDQDAGGGGGKGGGAGGNAGQTKKQNPPTRGGSPAQDLSQFTRLGIDTQKILERQAMRTANMLKFGINELKSKLEFQALIVQLFLQRRFEHVLIACRIYNNMFSGQDRELKIKEGSDVEKMFAKGLGVNPTISTLETFASEAIRDVDEGVKSFEYSLDKQELQTASNRLLEAFGIGEYLPRVRTLERKKKERILEFTRDFNMLISSCEMKDFGRADEILSKVKSRSTDFDDSKFRAAIESSKAGANMHIESAKMAAMNKDTKKVEDEIKAATLLWPTNPGLTAFTKDLSETGNIQTRIIMDFDSLLAQQNYRQIAKDMVKYSGAMINMPEKAEKLKEVLEKVKKSETAVIKADELAKSDNAWGAWESVQEALIEMPDDSELNKRGSQLSSQVSDFAQALARAKALESKKQYGASLAWFLKAKRIYPVSRMAKEGIARNADAILPDAGVSSLSLPPPTKSSTPEISELPPPTKAAP
jgi:tetratricopeptide (TPR) repeat protein